MATQALSEQAARRDSSEFRAQVSAALDREILDIVQGRSSWAGEPGEKAAHYARTLLASSPARHEAIESCVRIAAADLVGESAPADVKIAKAVRRALRFSLSIPQEA